ncbi:MAG: PKD domain-containing protein, partial [Thermoplasmata archaeon]
DEREDGKQIFFKRTLPDFIIEDVDAPSEAWANSIVNLNLTVNDIGYADGYNVPIIIKNSAQVLYERIIDQIILNNKKQISIPWKPPHEGQYNLEFIIDDDNKLEEWNEDNNIFYKNITVNKNAAPTAVLEVDSTEVKTGQDITFDASKSYDPDGSVTSYYFDFGDGNNSGWIDKSIFNYNYSNPGTFLIRLTVRDNYGGENSNDASMQIKVELRELPPVIDDVSTSPQNPVLNENVTITVTATDPNSDPIEYIFEPANGSIIGTGANVIWRSPSQAGEYQIVIKAFDGVLYSAPYSLKIKVSENHPPKIHDIDFNKSMIEPGEIVNLTINASDTDGHTLNYYYESSAGAIDGSDTNITWHSPMEAGIYFIKINISDNHNGYDSTTLFFIVGDPAPGCLIKSFEITPDKIYRNKATEVLITIEIEPDYLEFINLIQVDLSAFTGNPSQLLFDTGTNGDAYANDGIYSYKAEFLIDNFTGELPILATVETTIPGFELNTSAIITVETEPVTEKESGKELYYGISIVILVILIIIMLIWLRRRKIWPEEKPDESRKNEI